MYSIDYRISAGLKYSDNVADNTHEIHFEALGRRLFLSSLKRNLQDEGYSKYQHWVEMTVMNLPSYEELVKVLEAEGSDL